MNRNMDIIRFVLPFLFVRNWHTGVWELSRSRLSIFIGGILLVMLALGIAYFLQSPVVYTTQAL